MEPSSVCVAERGIKQKCNQVLSLVSKNFKIFRFTYFTSTMLLNVLNSDETLIVETVGYIFS